MGIIKSLGLFAATFIVFVSFLVYAVTDNPQKNEIVSRNDAIIAMSIKDDIFMDPSLEGMNITVTSKEGVVTLSGIIDTPATRDKLGELARKEHGVLLVHNELKIL